jgi:hypothetical protein
MTQDEATIPAWPHKPAPPEPKRMLPEWPLLWRGLALAAAGVVVLAGEREALRHFKALGIALAPVAAAGALLFGWAAAIHLTGGERFDDHKWV